MELLDRITVFRQDRRTDVGAGQLKLGPDYACIYISDSGDNVLPDRDVRGYSVVASGGGEVRYTGEIVGISVHENSRRLRTTLRCKPADPPDR